MGFQEAITAGFRNYVNFTDRASRSEFWYWTLFVVLLSIVTALIDQFAFPTSQLSPLNSIAGLVTFLPGLSVAVRRLHDLDRTGWWILIGLTGIGLILLIVWDCMKGTPGPNRFGPDPLAGQP
jgi:uncharacterized membrane protein YhaH (DUF805 family)